VKTAQSRNKAGKRDAVSASKLQCVESVWC